MEFTREQFQKWGQEGGRKRAKALTPERRSEIAKKAGSAPKRKRTKAVKIPT
jgi:general stress protein YciG